MRYRTHLAFGLFAGLMFLPNDYFYKQLLFIGVVLLGSLLPDVDTPESKLGNKTGFIAYFLRFIAGHRGFFHSAFAAFIFAGILWITLGEFYGVALFVGYASHLLIDGLTKSGINYLHPLSNLRVSGFITTGGLSEMILLVGIVAVDVWKIIEMFF